ncbi:MAG TPA: hypothetical protein ENI84_00970 [Thiothrix sp.]|nr:hypothetical protein [Thiothrix sp.]
MKILFFKKISTKVITYLGVLISVALIAMASMTPSYASSGTEETNDLNMSGQAVKVIKKYPGMWKGWSDGCVNCGKPLASDLVSTKAKSNKSKEKKAATEKEQKAHRPEVPKSVRRGYCECNCKPAPSSTSMRGTIERNNKSDSSETSSSKKSENATKPAQEGAMALDAVTTEKEAKPMKSTMGNDAMSKDKKDDQSPSKSDSTKEMEGPKSGDQFKIKDR